MTLLQQLRQRDFTDAAATKYLKAGEALSNLGDGVYTKLEEANGAEYTAFVTKGYCLSSQVHSMLCQLAKPPATVQESTISSGFDKQRSDDGFDDTYANEDDDDAARRRYSRF